MRFYDNLIGHDPDIHLNSRGHRCKDIEEVNLHNYILFVGDNVALDFNSPIEETYPFLISKKLSVDYYNLSIFNGGIDVIKYNCLAWYYKYTKPKAIVISTEFLNSIITSTASGDDMKTADYSDSEIQQIMTAGETTGFFPGRRLLAQNVLSTHLVSPIYQIVFKNKLPLFDKGVTNINHQGDIFDHESITNEFINVYFQKTRSMMP